MPSDLAIALVRGAVRVDGPAQEWLVTNGRGGFASGTVAGPLTRRYHGLLVGATRPPVGRRRWVAAVDEVVTFGASRFELAAHRWADGTVAPQGWAHLDRFALVEGVPTWTYALEDARVVKEVWLEPGHDVVYCAYTLVRGRAGSLALTVLVSDRDFHGTTRAGRDGPAVARVDDGVDVAMTGGVALHVRLRGAQVRVEPVWYRDYRLTTETYRGLDDHDDNFRVATLTVPLREGETATLLARHGDVDVDVDRARKRVRTRAESLYERAGNPDDRRVAALVRAADQFIVARGQAGATVIAGYPWFGDWGRDTMIALPGLTLATGRPEIAARILRTFAGFVDGGMIPNRFPDEGQAPDYNTLDATLWYVHALGRYLACTSDLALVRELWPTLETIFDAHLQGTRHGIVVDPADGLLRGGEEGVQLTWMDAKVGDWVVTPRIGKPVEINALWIATCLTLADFATRLGADPRRFAEAASHARRGFRRFYNDARGFLFDVIDGPEGEDPRLRPNQIFAVCLVPDLLAPAQRRAVVEVVARQLYTPLGLRSLGPEEPGYLAHYGGGPRQRDAAYHQGTAWTWLLGPFARAHAIAYGDRTAARSFLEPALDHVVGPGLGQLPEIADGDPPHTPRGCPAQAWSVAEVLAAWTELSAS